MELQSPVIPCCFRTHPSPGETTDAGILSDESPLDEKKEDPSILCRQCGHTITRPQDRIQVEGSHRHTFVNPHGLVFEIGCFQRAEGCVYSGRATEEYTWFRGFAWRITVCAKCLSHLGWQFVSTLGTTRFHGLIVDRLIVPDP